VQPLFSTYVFLFKKFLISNNLPQFLPDDFVGYDYHSQYGEVNGSMFGNSRELKIYLALFTETQKVRIPKEKGILFQRREDIPGSADFPQASASIGFIVPNSSCFPGGPAAKKITSFHST